MKAATMGKQKKILLIDDDEAFCRNMKEILSDEGYEVDTAANGLDIKNLLLRNQPDLVLLDIRLSWIDGYGLCRAIKQGKDFRDIPVLFISGLVSDDDIHKGFNAGCDDYFTKPIEFDRLLKRIAELISS